MTDEYDALVYDLDGTLVRLDVDWDAVARDVAGTLQARGVDTAGATLWEMLEQADEAGHRPAVEETIAEHERSGARTSERLALADELPAAVPVAICSLNSAAACRIALELHGLDGYVDAIVGRDSLDVHKPDPQALLAAVDAVGTDPSRTLFVGDSERDRTTAKRAGVDFEWASEWQ